MYKYEKIEHDCHLPTKLLDFFVENESEEPIERHWHRSVEILIPFYGSFILWINGNRVKVSAGDIYIINSQDIHGILTEKDEKIYKGYTLQIQYEYLKDCYDKIDEVYFKQPSDETKQIILSKLIDILSIYENKENFHSLLIKSQIQMLVFLMLDNLSTKRKDVIKLKNNKNKERIKKIIQYMEDSYQEDLSNHKIAEHFQLSEGYLSKLFKDNLDMTVKEYLNHIRLWHAEEQLIENDYPIIDIAICNGFPNVRSFNQQFKRKNGMTPAKYREKMRK